ncbi:MAG: chemotaxis protein CheX [Lachnospiraceae bacterium]|nr:chemotaxis protein CheX [Lachnospiraceae bacterium]
MYAQFFGGYLLSKGAVSPEQLTSAISKLSDTHIKLGTLAMHKGYMTASEVDEVCFLQTREDKRFGEIAIERCYLFENQLEDLLQSQNPDYLLLGQTLVDMGALSNADLEALMVEYQEDNAIEDCASGNEDAETSIHLVENLLESADIQTSDYALAFLNLIFNNLVRFIGEDFTPLAPVHVDDYPLNYCVSQRLTGAVKFNAGLDMEPDVAVAFASRYANMDFDSFDEYVKASLEDFLNLHNGLFSVNMSNYYSIELNLEPPMQVEESEMHLSNNGFIIPIIYPFGTIYMILEI